MLISEVPNISILIQKSNAMREDTPLVHLICPNCEEKNDFPLDIYGEVITCTHCFDSIDTKLHFEPLLNNRWAMFCLRHSIFSAQCVAVFFAAPLSAGRGWLWGTLTFIAVFSVVSWLVHRLTVFAVGAVLSRHRTDER